MRGEHKGDANRDPITGTPGAHPVGTGIGAAAGGAAAGAAAGTVAGPVGTAAGMVAGAVIGGLAGKGIAEKINPTVESGYWRENYSSRSYVDRGARWEDYEPAYRTGYEGYGRHHGRRFDDWRPSCAVRTNAPAMAVRCSGTKRVTRLATHGTASSAKSPVIKTSVAKSEPVCSPGFSLFRRPYGICCVAGQAKARTTNKGRSGSPRQSRRAIVGA